MSDRKTDDWMCRNDEISLELIRCSHDSDAMLDRVLVEFEQRLEELSADVLDERTGPPSEEDRRRLRAIAMLSRQMSALMEKSAAVSKLRGWAEEQQRLNMELQRSWRREQELRSDLEGVLHVLDVAILVIAEDRTVKNCNSRFAEWVAISPDDLLGQPVEKFVGEVLPGQTGVAVLTVDIDDTAGVNDGGVAIAQPAELHVEINRRNLPGVGEVVWMRRLPIGDTTWMRQVGSELDELGMICHRINNPLTPLLGRAQILAVRKDLPEPAVKGVRIVEESARRIADDIRELAFRVRVLREQTRQRTADTGATDEV
ncbi:MAG: hypothetical protein OES25_02580 [Acidobacteriota bacterium]|nr:hypothetical protein [Acidobacteriota bacterium]